MIGSVNASRSGHMAWFVGLLVLLSLNAAATILVYRPSLGGVEFSDIRATILRAQLGQLDQNCKRWNDRYQALEAGLRGIAGVEVVERPQHEAYVGSSFQFHANVPDIPELVAACGRRGVELKWFGGAEPVAFTSRYDSWQYFGEVEPLPQTLKTLSTTVDLRVPLTFSIEDCSDIAEIIAEEASRLAA